MFRFRILPWEYGVRNLLRRPARTLLTLFALTLVVTLILVVLGFLRGLERSLGRSGDPDVMLVHALGAGENLESSSIPAGTAGLLAASLSGIQHRYDVPCVSPELYLAVRLRVGDQAEALGLVRGVTPTAPLVRRQVRIVEGQWPGPGEVLAGRLAAAKLGCRDSQLAIGQPVRFEGRTWRVSGRFTADGSNLEAELWCPLADLQPAMKRQDVSLVALLLRPDASPADVRLFCLERVDLELRALSELEYSAGLRRHYGPVRVLAWLVMLMIAAAGVFAGLNMMSGAVAGRTREMATLQAIGYRRRAILGSLIQEGTLLAATASLLAALLTTLIVNGLAVRFTMGAFTLHVDGPALLAGCGVGLLLGAAGALPPAVKALRQPVAAGLRAI
ncbi:MAG: ABC transporter permease [Pirellulaceae bacterium]|nr:ABC transporter permease [Pirellulaceae bacterium]